MYYEINVAKLAPVTSYNPTPSHKHYFATSPRSLTTSKEAKILLAHFVLLFPEPEYNITMTKMFEGGQIININQFLNEDQ